MEIRRFIQQYRHAFLLDDGPPDFGRPSMVKTLSLKFFKPTMASSHFTLVEG